MNFVTWLTAAVGNLIACPSFWSIALLSHPITGRSRIRCVLSTLNTQGVPQRTLILPIGTRHKLTYSMIMYRPYFLTWLLDCAWGEISPEVSGRWLQLYRGGREGRWHTATVLYITHLTVHISASGLDYSASSWEWTGQETLTVGECPVTSLYLSEHKCAVVWVILMKKNKKKIKKRTKAECDEGMKGE